MLEKTGESLARVPNLFGFVKSVFTPPKGRQERTGFSLGGRPIHGQQPPDPATKPPAPQSKDARPLSKSLDENEKALKKAFHVPTSSDVVFRDMVCDDPRVHVSVAYVEGLASFDRVYACALQPLMLLSSVRKGSAKDPVKQLKEALLLSGQVIEKSTLDDLAAAMVVGDTAILIEGQDRGLVVETKGWEHRAVGQAVSERIVRGPQQGFVETMRVNTALVRSIVQTPDLVVENVDLGVRVRTKCALLYIDGLVNPKIVAEARRRLHGIDTSEVLTSGTLEQLIETSHSLLPTGLSTERPDRVAHFLLMGACAIVVAGDPFALVVPITFFTLIHSPEDNYMRWPYGNLMRAIRFIGLLLVVYLPGLYVAIVSYHPELIPAPLAMAIAASREPIPFPLWVEITLMFLGFELIREAGIRIPSPIGPTIGIVGALLIGEAAVAASIVSPILVILVAFTAVASFTIPNQELAMFTRLATLIMVIIGTTLGLFGIVSLTYIGLCHAFNLKSMGIPYFSPLTPSRPGVAFGIPVIPPWQAGVRPAELRPKDLVRQPKKARLWDAGRTLPETSQIAGTDEGGVIGEGGQQSLPNAEGSSTERKSEAKRDQCNRQRK